MTAFAVDRVMGQKVSSREEHEASLAVAEDSHREWDTGNESRSVKEKAGINVGK